MQYAVRKFSTVFTPKQSSGLSMESLNREGNEILSVGFSHDSQFIGCGMTNGFGLYQARPFFKELLWMDYPDADISLIDIFEDKALAFVGRGKHPKLPNDKVVIWEASVGNVAREVRFSSPVLSVRLSDIYLVIGLKNETYVYRFLDLTLIDQIEHVPNPRGLLSLSKSDSQYHFVIPGLAKGYIRLLMCRKNHKEKNATFVILGHSTSLSQLAINDSGTKMASEAQNDNYINVWSCENGDKLFRFKKHEDSLDSCYLVFNDQDSFLALSHLSGNTFIYSLKARFGRECNETDEEEQNCVDAQAFGFFGAISCGLFVMSPSELEIMDSIGFAFIRNNNNNNNNNSSSNKNRDSLSKSICAFNHKSHKLMIINFNLGTIDKYDFIEGGETFKIEESHQSLDQK